MVALRKILLTGGTGMVGRNILEHPAASQWEFLAPSRAELNLADYRAVEAYIRGTQPNVVIHTAGRVGGIQANVANPVAFLVDNIDVGRNVIMAARAGGVQRLLNLASSCIYPPNAQNPLSEALILQGGLEPTNEGYALAKIVALRLCQYICRETPKLLYKTLIPCNLYGPHDKFVPEHSHLIPAIIHKVHRAKVESAYEIEMWGDGSVRREFMYVGDAGAAVLRAIEDFDVLPDVMNIGLGYDYTVNEYYTAAADVIGWQGRFVRDLTKPVGMKRKLLDITRQRMWGWQPVTSLHDGIAKTYAFYLQHYDR